MKGTKYWGILVDTFRKYEYLYGALYVHKDAAIAELNNLDRINSERGYTLKEVISDGIHEGRIVYDGLLFHLDESTGEEKHRRIGFAKLTYNERVALGLVISDE